ncbi:MAG: homoserine dehydrogenase [Flavobacteriales bacterium]|nr:homoserine dehydrogenase [Flavobacteriales bacterium]
MDTIKNNLPASDGIKIYGFGVVAKGFYDYLQKSNEAERLQIVIIKDASKKRAVINAIIETTNENTIRDKDVDVIVELISSSEEAYGIVAENLEIGKKVISANKKLIAENLQDLISKEKENNGTFLYEGAVCGSIPIIRILNDFYSTESIQSVKGIFNGSSNYILSQLFNKEVTYGEALKQAQDLGFAEADPTSDVGGFDALYKLVILATHSFGKIIHPNEILNFGIENISKSDIELAKKLNLKIKLIAKAELKSGKLSLSVLPTLVDSSSGLYQVENEYNAVEISSENVGVQFYKGKGAGGLPTGSVVYSDLKAIDNNYNYSYGKLNQSNIILDNFSQVDVLIKIPNKDDVDTLPFNVSYLTKVDGEENYFYAKTTLNEIQVNKKYIEQYGISLLFIDNEEIKIQLLSSDEAEVKTINVAELRNWIIKDDDFQLIDVRESSEYEFTNINGELIPLGEIESNLSKIQKDRKVVFQCRSGKRSADAIKLLQKKYGFDNLYNLEGGILAWADEIDSSIKKY